ncbi:hypothetical protein JOQ06_021616 [Pogonophryne albipinna]|uniref:RNA-binding protein NOB1 n=1 Tax=Pogonophryne albipinna TaxID=1090488 RepID=A0AAD6F690_9TELE|nr:hypothetical protein JOQ06_021616 [Pogonophryne albipinna]
MAPTLVAHVVADAGAFLKKAPLQEIGSTIYTLKDVVDEIRDKPTRRSLAFLPYNLTFREPHPEHIRHVTEFSKKTGDYPSLSATDIKVLALTYQLELEHVGSKHLKKEPEVKVNVHSTQRHPETPVNVAGFFLPSREKKSSESVGVRQKFPDGDPFNSFQFWRPALPTVDKELLQLLDPLEVSDPKETSSDSFNTFNSFQFWRPPLASIDSLMHLLVKMDSSDWTAPADVIVGCLTTDFAMQNVLIQIGLHVLSVNGMLIKQARNYILRCHACFKTTSNMSKLFCPHCGNRTLKKIAVTVRADGNTQMHFSKNPKHSLPMPQGGKHGNNPQLVEDQRFPQQRLSRKARQKTNVFDPDFVTGASPFSQNDIYSRAANLQIRDGQGGGGRRRANPNAAHKKFVKKN